MPTTPSHSHTPPLKPNPPIHDFSPPALSPQAVEGADVFLGLSAGNLLTPEMLLTMARDPVVFACANPVPEIDPDVAVATRPDVIIATGRRWVTRRSVGGGGGGLASWVDRCRPWRVGLCACEVCGVRGCIAQGVA